MQRPDLDAIKLKSLRNTPNPGEQRKSIVNYAKHLERVALNFAHWLDDGCTCFYHDDDDPSKPCTRCKARTFIKDMEVKKCGDIRNWSEAEGENGPPDSCS